MRSQTSIVRVVVLVLLMLAVAVPVAAQGEEILPCAGEGVSGTVVAVDPETGVVTISTAGGLCTVALNGEYDHPIVALLGAYFGDISAETLAESLQATQGCATLDELTGEYTWGDCTPDSVEVTVIGENDDGTFTALVDGVEVTLLVDDPDVAESLGEALAALLVDWELSPDGTLVQPGDQIAAYHDEGIGFGVIVKLYGIAAASQADCPDDPAEPCGATVDELLAAFQSGIGMGELFREYGRPATLGVGHVRHGNGPPPHAGPPDDGDEPGPPPHAGQNGRGGGPGNDNGNHGNGNRGNGRGRGHQDD
jgi:hypothetical protein